MQIKVGDKLPDAIKLYEDAPDNAVDIHELCAGKKVVLFGVPGAFTPTCSKSHLPGFLESHDKIVAKGIDVVACISVNDPFVMAAWGEANKASGKVRMLADTHGEFTKAIGMEFDLSAALGTVRSKRFAMFVDDNTVKALNVEPDGKGLTCSAAKNIVDEI